MKAKTKHLKNLCQHRQLVSIQRKEIDSSSFYGFIAGYSETLVCVIIINDFCLDGMSVIRRKDISKLKLSDTDRLHKQMLEADGILEKIDFSDCPPLTSWHDLFETRSDEEVVIIEDEASEDSIFFIGRVLSAEKKSVAGHFFNGLGEWDEDPWEIRYKKITRCQLKSNYGTAYERHFDRLKEADSG